MTKEVDIVLLEKYVLGEIEADQVLYDDGLVVSAEDLELAVKEFEDVALGLKAIEVHKRLKVIHKKLEVNRRKQLKVFSIAASIALISIFSFLLLRTSEPQFSDYFSHFPELLSFRNDEGTNYSAALQSYSDLNYQQALAQFESLLELRDNPDLNFYAGISALGAKDYDKALQYLDRTIDSNYSEQSRWYSALALWQLKNIQQAIIRLQLIKKGEYEYENAQRLIAQLKGL